VGGCGVVLNGTRTWEITWEHSGPTLRQTKYPRACTKHIIQPTRETHSASWGRTPHPRPPPCHRARQPPSQPPRTSPQRELRVGRHRVCFVEDHQLHTRGEQLARAREALDLVAHDVNATVVRRVQLHGITAVAVAVAVAAVVSGVQCAECQRSGGGRVRGAVRGVSAVGTHVAGCCPTTPPLHT
jgi:hypothetical protein